jgi:tetratricopeptide (TPR) repeat protein
VSFQRPRGRAPGIDINPAALRQARLDAGLSLAQTAGPGLTRQAVHLFETGKSRPSMESLELIADNLDMPIGLLLSRLQAGRSHATDPRLAGLERLAGLREYRRVVERAQQVLAEGGTPPVLAVAHRHLGQALSYLNRPGEALQHLDEARRLYEALGDGEGVAETMQLQALALCVREDPRALRIGEDALARLRTVEPRNPETEARLLARVGTILYGRRSYRLALARYDEALQVSGGMRELGEMGRIYHGQGMCYRGLGDLRRAAELLMKAMALYEAEERLAPSQGRSDLARVENDLGLIMMEQGDVDRADELMRASIGHFAEAQVERGKAHTLLSMAELRLRQQRFDDATWLVRQAIALTERLGETMTLAAAHQQLGVIHELRGRSRLAGTSFRRALALLEEAGLEERRAECMRAWDEARERRARASG